MSIPEGPNGRGCYPKQRDGKKCNCFDKTMVDKTGPHKENCFSSLRSELVLGVSIIILAALIFMSAESLHMDCMTNAPSTTIQ